MSPAPSLQSLAGQLPDEITEAWRESKSQYVIEYSNSVASALAENVTAGQDEAKDALLKAEHLLDNVDDLDDEDIPTVQDILNIDVDRLDFYDDEVSEGRFSRLAGERTVQSRLVLETAKRLKTDFGHKVRAPKVTSSSEQATA